MMTLVCFITMVACAIYALRYATLRWTLNVPSLFLGAASVYFSVVTMAALVVGYTISPAMLYLIIPCLMACGVAHRDLRSMRPRFG